MSGNARKSERRHVYCEDPDAPVIFEGDMPAGVDQSLGDARAAKFEVKADVDQTLAQAATRAAKHLAQVARRSSRHGGLPSWGEALLSEQRYCVIDLETTGSAAEAEILEVGAVQVAYGEIGLEFASLVLPSQPISPASRAIHGIADADVASAPPLGTVLPQLVELTRGRVLVFHNAGFDMGFLQRALGEHGAEPFTSPVIDTVVLARRVLGGRCGLGAAAARLGIPAPHLHRALPDARLTALLLLQLLDVLHAAGARRLGEVPGAQRYRSLARRPARPQPLVARLGRAIARGETLRFDYRAAPGLVPHSFEAEPLQLASGILMARRQEDGLMLQLRLSHIDRLRSRH